MMCGTRYTERVPRQKGLAGGRGEHSSPPGGKHDSATKGEWFESQSLS